MFGTTSEAVNLVAELFGRGARGASDWTDGVVCSEGALVTATRTPFFCFHTHVPKGCPPALNTHLFFFCPHLTVFFIIARRGAHENLCPREHVPCPSCRPC